jgi:hypothetical protein
MAPAIVVNLTFVELSHREEIFSFCESTIFERQGVAEG